MMTEAHLGRLLPACLHQAIADVLPDRLEYYEEWLDPVDLRNGSIGLAPLSAVNGFLRIEGTRYTEVVERAGVLAAAWSLDSVSPSWRRVGASLPTGLRARFALRIVRRIVRDILSSSSATSKVSRGRATVTVDSSAFCMVRDRSAVPLCGFYRALTVEVLRSFHVSANASIESCQAVSGNRQCVIAIEIGARARADEPAIAA